MTDSGGDENGIQAEAGARLGDEAGLLLRQLPGHWYVAHTRARHEKALGQELNRYGIPSYLPLTERVTRSANTGRLTRSQVPVFPGYIFFNATGEQRYLALTTNRIANVLTVPDQGQFLGELRQIAHLVSAGEPFSTTHDLHQGDWGRIVGGGLVGLEGTVETAQGRFRICMNVTILGRSVSVEVERELVERIDGPTYG